MLSYHSRMFDDSKIPKPSRLCCRQVPTDFQNLVEQSNVLASSGLELISCLGSIIEKFHGICSSKDGIVLLVLLPSTERFLKFDGAHFCQSFSGRVPASFGLATADFGPPGISNARDGIGQHVRNNEIVNVWQRCRSPSIAIIMHFVVLVGINLIFPSTKLRSSLSCHSPRGKMRASCIASSLLPHG